MTHHHRTFARTLLGFFALISSALFAADLPPVMVVPDHCSVQMAEVANFSDYYGANATTVLAIPPSGIPFFAATTYSSPAVNVRGNGQTGSPTLWSQRHSGGGRAPKVRALDAYSEGPQSRAKRQAVVVGYSNGLVKVFDKEQAEPGRRKWPSWTVTDYGNGYNISRVQFSGTRKWVFSVAKKNGEAETLLRLNELEGERRNYQIKLVGENANERISALDVVDGAAVTGGANGTVRIWSMRNGAATVLKERTGETQSTNPKIESVRFSANPEGDRLLAAGSAGREITLWNVPRESVGEAKVVDTLQTRSAGVRVLKFSRASDQLFSGYKDGSAQVWNPETGTARAYIPPSKHGKVIDAHFVPNQKGSKETLVLVAYENGITLWQIPKDNLHREVIAHPVQSYQVGPGKVTGLHLENRSRITASNPLRFYVEKTDTTVRRGEIPTEISDAPAARVAPFPLPDAPARESSPNGAGTRRGSRQQQRLLFDN